MKIVTPIEKVILTAEEKAIITEAKKIFWEMYSNCKENSTLEQRTNNIIENIDLLESEQGEEYIIEVEPTNRTTITITI